MSVETALRSILLADSTVESMVATRIYPLKATQGGEYPHVKYHRAGGGHSYCMRGRMRDGESLWQFDCWSPLCAEARDLATAVGEALSGFRGHVEGITFQGIFVQDEFDAIDPPEFGDDVGLYWVPVGIQVWEG